MGRATASFVGFIALMVFLIIVVLASADWIDGIKANATKCTDARALLGLCTK